MPVAPPSVGFVRVKFTGPKEPVGLVAVTMVLSEVTLVAAVPPNVTMTQPKPVPVIVTTDPPATGPEDGDIEVISGMLLPLQDANAGKETKKDKPVATTSKAALRISFLSFCKHSPIILQPHINVLAHISAIKGRSNARACTLTI